jgi:protein-tyrosine phosphatase
MTGMASTTDVDLILPGLWLGNHDTAANTPLLKKHGITHIITAMREPTIQGKQWLVKNIESFKDSNGFCRLLLPLNDRPFQNIIQYFDFATEYIRTAIDQKGAVLVHCWVGKSRSATLVAAYVMKTLKLDPIAALNFINERSSIFPNIGFFDQLQLWRQSNFRLEGPAYNLWTVRCSAQLLPEHPKVRPDCPLSCIYDIPFQRPTNKCCIPESVGPCDIKCICGKELVLASLTIPSSDGLQRFVSLPMDWMEGLFEADSGRLRCPECRRVLGWFDWRGGPDDKLEWVKPIFALTKNFTHPQR